MFVCLPVDRLQASSIAGQDRQVGNNNNNAVYQSFIVVDRQTHAQVHHQKPCLY